MTTHESTTKKLAQLEKRVRALERHQYNINNDVRAIEQRTWRMSDKDHRTVLGNMLNVFCGITERRFKDIRLLAFIGLGWLLGLSAVVLANGF